MWRQGGCGVGRRLRCVLYVSGIVPVQAERERAYLLGIKCQDIGYTEKGHDIGYKYNQEDTVVWWNSGLVIERAGVRMFSRFMRRRKLTSAFVLGKTARMSGFWPAISGRLAGLFARGELFGKPSAR
jgi:hypothetical protein